MTSEPDSEIVDGLASQLRKLAKGGGAMDVAKFQFVGFDEIARAYGDKWSAHKQRVKDTAHAFITRRLGPDDVLVRGSDGFLLIYGGDNSAAAEAHSHDVKGELNEFFLGEGASRPTAQMSVSHARLPVADLITTIGDLDFVTAARKAEDDALAGIDWKFQPVWDARKEAVFNYYIAPVLKETGERVPGYQFDMDLEREFNFVDIDEVSLTKSEIAIRQMVRGGNRSLLGTSIHSSSLLKLSSRNRLLDVMSKFNQDLVRYRAIQISAIPPGFPRMYLDDIYRAIKQRVPSIALSLSWNENDIRSALELGPAAIGFTLSPWALGENASVSQAELCAKVKTASDIARQAKCPFFFDGYASKALVARMRALGVDIISSPVVWPMLDAPSGVQRWASEQLAA